MCFLPIQEPVKSQLQRYVLQLMPLHQSKKTKHSQTECTMLPSRRS